MTAFRVAMDALYGDPHLSVAGTFRRGSYERAVRLMLRRPDVVADGLGGPLVHAAVVAHMRASDISGDPAAGDEVEAAGVQYVVHGRPTLDALRLEWTMELRPR